MLYQLSYRDVGSSPHRGLLNESIFLQDYCFHRIPQWTTCTPIRKIGFANTHKTASSTVQNVLLRYGLVNSAEFVLPEKENYLGNMMRPWAVEYLDRDGSTMNNEDIHGFIVLLAEFSTWDAG